MGKRVAKGFNETQINQLRGIVDIVLDERTSKQRTNAAVDGKSFTTNLVQDQIDYLNKKYIERAYSTYTTFGKYLSPIKHKMERQRTITLRAVKNALRLLHSISYVNTLNGFDINITYRHVITLKVEFADKQCLLTFTRRDGTVVNEKFDTLLDAVASISGCAVFYAVR